MKNERKQNGMNEYGEWLKKELKKRKITQTALAKHLGTAPECVTRWVKGTIVPRKQTIARINRLFGEKTELEILIDTLKEKTQENYVIKTSVYRSGEMIDSHETTHVVEYVRLKMEDINKIIEYLSSIDEENNMPWEKE